MPQVPMKSLLPEVSEPAIQNNLHWLAPRFYDAANKTAAVHIQSWLIRTDTSHNSCRHLWRQFQAAQLFSGVRHAQWSLS